MKRKRGRSQESEYVREWTRYNLLRALVERYGDGLAFSELVKEAGVDKRDKSDVNALLGNMLKLARIVFTSRMTIAEGVPAVSTMQAVILPGKGIVKVRIGSGPEVERRIVTESIQPSIERLDQDLSRKPERGVYRAGRNAVRECLITYNKLVSLRDNLKARAKSTVFDDYPFPDVESAVVYRQDGVTIVYQNPDGMQFTSESGSYCLRFPETNPLRLVNEPLIGNVRDHGSIPLFRPRDRAPGPAGGGKDPLQRPS